MAPRREGPQPRAPHSSGPSTQQEHSKCLPPTRADDPRASCVSIPMLVPECSGNSVRKAGPQRPGLRCRPSRAGVSAGGCKRGKHRARPESQGRARPQGLGHRVLSGPPCHRGCPGGQSQCRPSLAKRQPGLPVTRPCGCLADEVPGVGTPPLHRQPEVARASPTPAPGLPRKKRGPTRDPSAQCLDGLWGAAQGTQPSSPLTGRGPVSLSNGPQWPGPHPTTSRGSPIPQARQQPLRTDKQRATGEN